MSDWRGPAGNEYSQRNPVTPEAVAAREKLWREIAVHMAGDLPQSILEVGANIGLHLRGLKGALIPSVPARRYFAVEPNDAARQRLIDDCVVWPGDAFDMIGALRFGSNFERFAKQGFDLIFTAGVLIHIAPEIEIDDGQDGKRREYPLLEMCRSIHSLSSRWIVAIEYFSQNPESVRYRGEMGRMWKRDFGGLYLDKFPDLKPVACGFAWKRLYPTIDDCVWTLLERI